jgi:hypothetical protein
MADSELLLQPEILAELERCRALEHRVQVSRQQGQEFKELAKQVEPRNTPSLSAPVRDGSPTAELDAVLAALRQQIETIHQIEAQLDEQQNALHKPPPNSQIPLPSQLQLILFTVNMKVALCVIVSIVLFFLLLTLLHSMIH